MELIRKPIIQEERFLNFLVKKSSLRLAGDWKDNWLACPMNNEETIVGKDVSKVENNGIWFVMVTFFLVR